MSVQSYDSSASDNVSDPTHCSSFLNARKTQGIAANSVFNRLIPDLNISKEIIN